MLLPSRHYSIGPQEQYFQGSLYESSDDNDDFLDDRDDDDNDEEE